MDYSNQGTAENICEHASKLITFIDLAGHQKYLRTTISALTGYCPHYVMLVVSATAGVVGMTQVMMRVMIVMMIMMTQEHLGIAVALEVPFFVVITKVDMVPREQLDKISATVTSVLKSAGATKVLMMIMIMLMIMMIIFSKVPLLVSTSDDCITAASNSLTSAVVPVFCVSSVRILASDWLRLIT